MARKTTRKKADAAGSTVRKAGRILKKTEKAGASSGSGASRKKVTKKKAKATVAKSRTKKTSKAPARKKRAAQPVLSREAKDLQTLERIEKLAADVVSKSLAQKDPFFDVPTRAVSNMRFNKKERILEMGSNTQRRELFNLNQARKFMQTILLSKGCKDLVEASKTLSLRGMYYMSLHTIEGTKEKTFPRHCATSRRARQ